MTRVELLALFRSLEKFHQMGKPEMALEVIQEIIEETKSVGKKDSKKTSD